MNYIKKHLKWIIVFAILLIVLCMIIFLDGKGEPIEKKETDAQETTMENSEESETSANNGITIEEKDPYDDEEWGPIG